MITQSTAIRGRGVAAALTFVEVCGSVALYVGMMATLLYQIAGAAGYLG